MRKVHPEELRWRCDNGHESSIDPADPADYEVGDTDDCVECDGDCVATIVAMRLICGCGARTDVLIEYRWPPKPGRPTKALVCRRCFTAWTELDAEAAKPENADWPIYRREPTKGN